jgi:transposase
VDYRHEVDHATERIIRLERALTAVVATAPAPLRAVIAALQALRGIAALGAVTVVTEVGQLSRLAHAGELMGYSGAVPRERSSGPTVRRGAITKTGNAHLRRILMEAAHPYRHRPAVGNTLRARQRGLREEVKAIAWKAQHRLHARYRHLSGKGKPIPKVITAVGRELVGFLWAIGVHVERQQAAHAA